MDQATRFAYESGLYLGALKSASGMISYLPSRRSFPDAEVEADFLRHKLSEIRAYIDKVTSDGYANSRITEFDSRTGGQYVDPRVENAQTNDAG